MAKRSVIKIGVVVAASAALSAGTASLLMAGGAGPVATPYALTAAIYDTNTTVGIADSDIIGMSTANINKTLDEMQSLGVKNVRILLPWNNIEPAPGVWNWTTVDTLVNAANSRGMGILGVLNSTPAWAVPAGDPAVATPPANDAQYAQFAAAVAQRYAGKVSAYEVWNEPNAATFWYPSPSPAAYTALLRAAYPAIKGADPNATVIGGVVGWVTDSAGKAISPAEFVQDMYNNGAKGYFDALSYHPYQYNIPFSQGKAYGSASPIGQLELMHSEMAAAGDGSKQIWASEYGEPTSVVSQATQASYISNFLNTWSSFSYTGPMFIYTTRDRNTGSTNPQDTFGLFQTDWTPKTAASVISAWTAAHPQTDPPSAGGPAGSSTGRPSPLGGLAMGINDATTVMGLESNGTLSVAGHVANIGMSALGDFAAAAGAFMKSAAHAPTTTATTTASTTSNTATTSETPATKTSAVTGSTKLSTASSGVTKAPSSPTSSTSSTSVSSPCAQKVAVSTAKSGSTSGSKK